MWIWNARISNTQRWTLQVLLVCRIPRELVVVDFSKDHLRGPNCLFRQRMHPVSSALQVHSTLSACCESRWIPIAWTINLPRLNYCLDPICEDQALGSYSSHLITLWLTMASLIQIKTLCWTKKPFSWQGNRCFFFFFLHEHRGTVLMDLVWFMIQWLQLFFFSPLLAPLRVG